MRGVRSIASWAPGVAARPAAQPKRSILGELYSGAHRHLLPVSPVTVQTGLTRLYSGSAGPARNAQNHCQRPPFGFAPYIYNNGMKTASFSSRVTDQVRLFVFDTAFIGSETDRPDEAESEQLNRT